jgi:hypothetical protein
MEDWGGEGVAPWEYLTVSLLEDLVHVVVQADSQSAQ